MRLSAISVFFVLVAVTPTAHAQLSFSDQTAASGVLTEHKSGLPCAYTGETMDAGGACGDFDGDGWQDLFVLCGGHTGDRLFMNDKDGTFTDRAADWKVSVQHIGVGAAVGDYDGDGRLDMYVTSRGPDACTIGPGHHKLYHNEGTSFTEVAKAMGVATTSVVEPDGWSAAFGDYDLDGDLDLATTGWIFHSGANRLFRNDTTQFTDVTREVIDFDLTPVRGFSVRFTDINRDHYPELLWVGDFGTSKYFINIGGHFIEATGPAGCGLDANGMGTTTGDFNGDGRIDWFVSSIGGSAGYTGDMLYRNIGHSLFHEESAAAGLKPNAWSWGSSAADFDLDGALDIAETNGWYPAAFLNIRSKLFRNLGTGTFEEIGEQCGIDHKGQGRGLLTFDYDLDGDPDIVIFTNQGELKLYRNDLPPGSANWLRLELDTSSKPNLAPNGFGARVVVSSNSHRQVRYLDGGSNFLSQSELPLHFGIGRATRIDILHVDWSDGSTTQLFDLTPNQVLTVTP